MAGVVRLSGADPDDAEYQPRTRETVAAHTFRRHMVEQIGPISGALSLLGAALQKPYREYWEAQKAKPHHHTGEGTPTNLALVSVRTPGDVMRSDLWAALRDPAFLQFSKDSHTLSTMKMTTSTHPPPHRMSVIQHEAKTKTKTVWTYTNEGMSGGMLKIGVLSMPENQEEDQGEHTGTADKENELPW
eukprot:XP_011609364.1 PREDICTED: vacuole membrane protein 1 [Takifugu rubripes]